MEKCEVKIKGVPRRTACELAGSLGNYVLGYEPIQKSREKIRDRITKQIAEEGKKRIKKETKIDLAD